MRNINVFSAFDGMSCGRLALDVAGIEVKHYYSSEIDKYASKVSLENYPGIEKFGDIQNWREWDIDWGNIDLLLGGSPCQGFSFAGKQLAFDDPRSKLFFVYVDILKHIQKVNPNVKFLLENVRMKQEYLEVISGLLGVEPEYINSALLTAQNRKRYYWTNWEFTQPEDKGILLKDIIHKNTGFGVLKDHGVWKKRNNKSNCICANYYKGADNHAQRTQIFEGLKEYIVPFDKALQILDKEVQRGKVGYFRKDSQENRVYCVHNEAVTLCGDAGEGAEKRGQYLFGCMTPDRVEKQQNGQRFNKGQKFYTLTAQDKHGILVEGYIRKLTPVECERLQTIPENYTSCVSNSQRYKMLGNGWTVDVIAHILKSSGLGEDKTLETKD